MQCILGLRGIPNVTLVYQSITSLFQIYSKALKETNVRDPESLAKEKNLSTVCDVVEISSKTLKETRIFRLGENLSTVCDVVEISFKALK